LLREAVLAGFRGRTKVFITVFLCIFFFGLSGVDAENADKAEKTAGIKESSISIAAVQFKVEKSSYSSERSFKDKINNVVNEIFSRYKPDLIIFPEYTSVFTALIPFLKKTEKIKSHAGALKKIKEYYPDINSIKELFAMQSDFTLSVMKDVFGTISEKYHIYILAGTYFAFDRKENRLYNRAVVFGPGGNVVYFQDKVFLTDFEKNIIDLSAGNIRKAAGFKLKNKKIAITICRDTYEEVWEDRFKNYAVWIDIKANGTDYDEEERESFLKALPARIRNTNVKYGITDSLTGRLFDLFWEGESSVVKNNAGSLLFPVHSKKYDDEEFIFYKLIF